MDARQDDLAVAGRDELLRFLADVHGLSRLHGATRVRDDAVRAEIFAAVLDFEERARALRVVVERDVLEFASIHDIRDVHDLPPLGHRLLDVLHDTVALLRAEHDGDTLDAFDVVGRDLRVAAADGDDGIGILAVRAADDLPALAVAEARDGTRIDDVGVGGRVKGADLMARFLEQAFHRLRLELVDLAAERHECDFQWLQISLFILDDAQRGNGCRLGAQDARTERDGPAARLQDGVGLGEREAALRADEHGDVAHFPG